MPEIAEGRRHLWTDAEREYMREHYPRTTIRQVAQALGRTEDAIVTEACKLGLYKAGRDNRGSTSKTARPHSPRTAQG